MENLKILIVEDDPIIAADLADRLREMGYAPLGPVPSGEEALLFFNEKTPPDLVLMDVQLEGKLDGIETARLVLEKDPRLPVIFLTSNSDDATFARAKSAHPAAFLSKPFRGRDLMHAIELAIAQTFSGENNTATAAPEHGANFLLDDRLFIKIKDRMVRVFFDDILWAEADDYYCKVATPEREFLVTQNLGKFSEALEKMPGFMRVHRSFLVNLRHVEQIGETRLHIGKKEIPVSRSSRDELLARLHKI